jgi:thiosulfate dehydrogenase [quinone] large subunit
MVDIAQQYTIKPTTGAASPHRRAAIARYVLAVLRLALGWMYLWSFLDKFFGLGHNTTVTKSWLNETSPTKRLGSAARGPLAGWYESVAGSAPVDAALMSALLVLGVTLIAGIGLRVAAGAGGLLNVLTWTVALPPTGNPVLDQHLIYAAMLVLLALLSAGNTWGLGRAWARTGLVRRAPWLT